MNSGKQKMSVYLPSVFMLFVLLTVFCGVKASADEFKSISFLRNQKVGEYYFSQYGGDFQEITIGVSKTSNGKKTALAKSNPLFPEASNGNAIDSHPITSATVRADK